MKTQAVLASIAISAAALAQTSAYYVTQGTSGPGKTWVMQNGQIQFNYNWAADGQMPIAIGDFGQGLRVRQACGQPTSGNPQQGDEYLLNGTPTGYTNFWNSGDPPNTTAYDATFDGTHIYMVHWLGATDGQVFMYDKNYANGQFLFNARSGDIGITYDSKTNSLWTSNWNDGKVTQWSMNGTQLFQYQPFPVGVAALAYDPVDDTFWMSISATGLLEQHDRNGTFLQSYRWPDYVLGGEIAVVPEPVSVLAFGAGLAALALKRRLSSRG